MPNLPYISPELLKQYHGDVASQTSPATAKRRMAALKKFFGWAHAEGHTPQDPFKELQVSNYQTPAQAETKPKKLNAGIFFKLAIPAALIILVFLLARKVKFPIPFLPAPAKETTIVTTTPAPTPVAEKPVDKTTIVAEVKEEALKLIGTTLEWASFEAGNLLIGGAPVSSLTLSTGDTTDGDITINPDGSGIAHFLFEGTGQNFLNAQAPNLTSGSLYYGIVANNATGYDLIRLQSGTKPITKFSVDGEGDTYASGQLNIAGDIQTSGIDRLTSAGALTNITGFTQSSGNFSVTQAAGETATITKKASALSDLLTLTLDERGKSNSIYSTLTLKRYNGAVEGAALYVDEGNAIFDGQVRLGRFGSNPTAIGTGSLIYNTSDTSLYVWNGSSWVNLGGGSIAGFWQRNSGALSPTNITDDVLTGGTATASALVRLPGLNNQDAWFNLGTGNVGIGTTSPGASLHLALDAASTNTQLELARLQRTTTGTAAAGIGSYTSSYLEDAGGGLFEAGRVQFFATNVTAGAASTTAFRVYVERETFSDMVPAFAARVTSADRFLCMNGTELDTPANWDCFGMTIGAANALVLNFDGTNRWSFDYAGDGANIITMRPTNTADELKVKTLGSKPIYFDASNDGTDFYISSGGSVGIGTTGPDRRLDVLDSTNPQLRLTQADGTVYAEFQVNASGNLSLQPAGSGTTANVQIGAGGAGSTTPDFLVLDAKNLTGNPTGTNGAMYYNVADAKFKCYENSAWTNCIGASGSSSWSALTNPTTNLTLEHTSAGTGFTSTFNWTDTTNNANFFTLSLDNNGGTAGTDQLLVLKNAESTATTGDLNTEALLLLDQTDTTVSGDTIVDDALLITNSGGSTLTDAIQIGTGTQAIGTAIRIGSTGVTTDIVLQNAETIDNNTDGTIALTTTTISSGATTVNFASAALTVSSCTGCGGGGSAVWSALTAPTTSLTLSHSAWTTTMNWTATGALDPWTMNLTNNAGTATTQRFVNIVNAATTQTIDINTEALLRLDNADTSVAGLTVVDDAILVTNSGGITSGVTDALDASAAEIVNAVNAGTNYLLLSTMRAFESAGTFTLEDTSGNDMLQVIDQGTTGRLAISDSLQVGSVGTTVAYSRFGATTTGHGLATADDVVLGDLEVEGVVYLDGKNIANPQGTSFLTLCVAGGVACATTSEIEHTLTNGSWTIQNPASGNVGKAALIVVQNMGGDIFTASSGATPTAKFTIANNGNVTISGSGTMLTVGGGTGKIDVGTVDPVYNISGTKFATYMAGMIGLKEETTGNISTSQYIPGVGYRTVIDFKVEPQGSDLWLFSRTTDIKNNIGKMVVLLSPSDNTRTWYEVDEANYTLSIYSNRPTTVSYRLTAPRFDYAQWTNNNTNPEATGFQVENTPLVGTGGETSPEAPKLSDFEIVKTITDTAYKVFQTISDGSQIAVEEFGAFANLVAGNVKAGAIEAKEITTDTLTAFQGNIDTLLINGGLVSPVVQTNLISPIADETDVKVQIGQANQDGTSGFGQLVIQDATGSVVASIDTQGNATFSGTLESDKVKANDVIAGKIYADEIVARNGFFAETNTASVSGITREEIEKILREVGEDQNILAQASTWNINTATNSANLGELAVSNLYVTDQAAVNTLSVTNSIALGPDLVLQSKLNEQNLTVNSIDTLSAPLSLQSLALTPLEIMAGKVRVDTNGDVTISGNLYVAGKIESSGLTLKDTGGFGELLNLEDGSGNQVAAISASGSAQFTSLLTGKLVIAGAETTPKVPDINQEIQTNATVGSAIIPTGITEITIRNPNISDYTLVYITPTSSTQNNALYVKSKGSGFFTVGFSNPVYLDVTFNWWVIDITASEVGGN